MESQKNTLNKEICDLIDATFEDHDNDLLSLVCVEHNNELIVGFIEVDETFCVDKPSYVISLPVNLIEYTEYDENNYMTTSYKLYPYKQIADKISDITFMANPTSVFYPSEDIIEAFINYWVRYSYNLTCNDNDIFDIITSTKS